MPLSDRCRSRLHRDWPGRARWLLEADIVVLQEECRFDRFCLNHGWVNDTTDSRLTCMTHSVLRTCDTRSEYWYRMYQNETQKD